MTERRFHPPPPATNPQAKVLIPIMGKLTARHATLTDFLGRHPSADARRAKRKAQAIGALTRTAGILAAVGCITGALALGAKLDSLFVLTASLFTPVPVFLGAKYARLKLQVPVLEQATALLEAPKEG